MLYKYLRRFELDLLQKPSRPGLVQIDWLVAVLTEGAAVVSELGGKLVELREGAVGGGGGVREVDWAVLCFARREELSDASARLRTTEAIMTKINSVLQVYVCFSCSHRAYLQPLRDRLFCMMRANIVRGDELEAMRHKTQSQEAVNSLLQSDGSLAHRMHRLQDVFGSRALVPRERLEAIAALPPPGYSIPAPTNEQLPDYTATDTPSSTQNQSHQDTNDNRGGNNNNDGSTTIRPGGSWSIFSSLTLADISILSLIPLPLESGNVRYSRFYTSSYCRSVNDELGALAESNTKNKAGPLARILGLREVGQKAKDERFARRMGMKYDEENPNRSRPQPPIRSLNL